jgi:enoyl-CoA hydratase
LERHATVALLTLDRPERRNALDARTLDEIDAVLAEVESDDALRALVITGAGETFSSGFDLKEQLERAPRGVDEWRPILTHDFSTVSRFWSFPKPTIAAVRGHCLAGACELALSCDLTIAADDAVFGEPELKFGAGIVVMILPWLTGPKVAKELIFTGAEFSATRALELGVPEALALAARIAVVDPLLVKATKRAINRAYEIMGLGQALDEALAIDLEIEANGSIDKQRFMDVARREGLRAAIAWRDARFGEDSKD